MGGKALELEEKGLVTVTISPAVPQSPASEPIQIEDVFDGHLRCV